MSAAFLSSGDDDISRIERVELPLSGLTVQAKSEPNARHPPMMKNGKPLICCEIRNGVSCYD